MPLASLPYIPAPRRRFFALGIFAVWLGIVVFLAANHVMWRDEVRALSLALEGDNIFGMFAAVHGEGHPTLWYILLRAAHTLFPTPLVLPIVALSVAAAALFLLARFSPFGWPLIIALFATRFALFEYTVMARNYGISMLLMFLLAIFYEKHRRKGFLPGALLFLLANTNVPSAILAGEFLLFWAWDAWSDKDSRRESLKAFLPNAALALLGILVCAVTVYPPFNDAAMMHKGGDDAWRAISTGMISPATLMYSLVLDPAFVHVVTILCPSLVQYLPVVMSLVMVGATLGLIRRPGACVAALAGLFGISLFFSLVYPGGYRHSAVWIVFLVSLYWIAGPPKKPSRVAGIGTALFVVLILLQIQQGVLSVLQTFADPPVSRSREVGAFIASRPDLKDAIILGDPDYVLEPLPYYVSNRTFLLRQNKFGRVVAFTRNNVRVHMTLADILEVAQNLHRTEGVPVVILLAVRLNADNPPMLYNESCWELATTPDQIRAFQAATTLEKSFAPALVDESYDVYTLKE